MKIISNYEIKSDKLAKILSNYLWDKNKEEYRYQDEASELLYSIEGVKDIKTLTERICSFYLNYKIDDKFSNYEELSKLIARDYLDFLSSQ